MSNIKQVGYYYTRTVVYKTPKAAGLLNYRKPHFRSPCWLKEKEGGFSQAKDKPDKVL